MMSTLRYTSANGGGGKAVPPKWFCGCRRGAAGVAFNRRGTVAIFAESYHEYLFLFILNISKACDTFRVAGLFFNIFFGSVQNEQNSKNFIGNLIRCPCGNPLCGLRRQKADRGKVRRRGRRAYRSYGMCVCAL